MDKRKLVLIIIVIILIIFLYPKERVIGGLHGFIRLGQVAYLEE